MLSGIRAPACVAAAALMAANSQAAAQGLPPYHVQGSDSWLGAVSEALETAKASIDPVFPLGDLVYDGSGFVLSYDDPGSVSAENQMVGNVQSLGPMSRNFKSDTLDAHPTWTPSVQNAAGIDAAVWLVRSRAGRIVDLTVPTNGPDPRGVANPRYAARNDPTVVGTFGVQGSGYTQLLEVVLSGVDGSGTVPACSDPRRVQAVVDLAAAMNVATIAHIYRLDDNSGTTLTIREKLQVSRFCNCWARGVLGNQGGVNTNLNNQDFDPIRRACPEPGLNNPTACTDMTTGLACQASDGNPNCTQGLAVALSVGDPGHGDVTEAMAYRVANDLTGSTMGYAGRAGARLGINTTAPTINTIGFSDTNIRLDQYMLSRLVFIHHAPENDDLGMWDAGGPAQAAQELVLFQWLTDLDGTNNADGAPGRCHLDPILSRWGFLPCTDRCDNTPIPPNLCGKTPFYPSTTFTPSCAPFDSNGGPSWGHAAIAKTSQPTCCSTNADPVAGACPAVANLPRNSACTQDADCAPGLQCNDGYGILINVCN